MKKRSILPFIIYVAILLLVFSWITGLWNDGGDNLAYSEILQLFYDQQVESFTVSGSDIYLTLHTPYNGQTSLRCTLADANALRQDLHELLVQQKKDGILLRYDFLPETQGSAFDLVLPLLIVGLVLLFLWLDILLPMLHLDIL